MAAILGGLFYCSFAQSSIELVFEKENTMLQWSKWILVLAAMAATGSAVYGTPSTDIWTPSVDIQPYGKIHFGADYYIPVKSRDGADNSTHTQQVYGPTFSLLSDKAEDNLLGKIWSPLGKVMAEVGFDYKKGFGTTADNYPVYGHFKFGVPEDAYFTNMPAIVAGVFDMGTKDNVTDNDVGYFKVGKTISIDKFSLGRFEAGYFTGNNKLLLDENGKADNSGPMLTWSRTMPEINDKLWLCVDYQGTNSSYGALFYGFSWKFNDNASVIVGYGVYNNPDAVDTVTIQFDFDF